MRTAAEESGSQDYKFSSTFVCLCLNVFAFVCVSVCVERVRVCVCWLLLNGYGWWWVNVVFLSSQFYVIHIHR